MYIHQEIFYDFLGWLNGNIFINAFIIFTSIVSFYITVIDCFSESKKREIFFRAVCASSLFLLGMYLFNIMAAMLFSSVYLYIYLGVRNWKIGVVISIVEYLSKSEKQAERCIEENRPRMALQYLEKCSEGVKSKPYYLMLYASAFMSLSNYQDALNKLNDINAKNKGQLIKVLKLKIECYEKLGNYQEALKCYRQAIKECSGDIWNLYYGCAALKIRVLEMSEYDVKAEDIINENSKDSFIASVFRDCSYAMKNGRYEAECHTFMGICYFYQNEHEKGLKELYDSENIEKGSPVNYLYFGIYYYKQKNDEEAAAYFHKCIDLDKNQHTAYYYLAEIYYKNKDYQQAIDMACKSLAICPSRAECHYIEAQCYGRKNMFQEAVDQLTCAIELKQEVKYYECRARYYGRFGNNKQKSLEDYTRCVELKDTPKYRFECFYYQVKLGMLPEKEVEEKLQPYIDNIDYYDDIADIYFSKKDYKKSVYYYKEYLKKNKNDSIVHYNLACALRNIDDLDDAIIHFKEAIRLNPNYMRAYDRLKGCYEMKGDKQKASEVQLQISNLRQKQTKINRKNGDAAYSLNQYEAAVEHYQNALKICSDDIPTVNNIACAYFGLYQTEEAVSYLQELISIHPDYAPAYYNLANCFLYLDRKKEAQDYYEKSVKLNSSFPIEVKQQEFLSVKNIKMLLDES